MGHIITGGKATAIVYGDYPDASETGQIYALLDSPAHKGCAIRIMPDHHAGKGCVIGFTSPLNMEKLMIIPALVGVDIGCGVQSINLKGFLPAKVVSRLPEFDKYLRKNVPAGFNGLDRPSKRREWLYKWWNGHGSDWDSFEADLENLAARVGTDAGKVWCSCGSLGGGNHFVEIGQGTDDALWLTVHSGSRNFGLRVAEFHQKNAVKRMGRRNGLEWLKGDEAASYLRDMRLAQKFAMLNRLVMLDVLADFYDLKLRDVEMITSVHNYIGDDGIIRKGAISANLDESVIIPWNMQSGLILGKGLGNPDWNNSAPHGAGRTMSRSAAKQTLSMDDFRKGMQDAGVWSSCVSKDTLDEAPMAYKDPASIEAYIASTVEIVNRLRPIYNFKAGKD